MATSTVTLCVGMTVNGSFEITHERISLFGQATGDMNPIHFDTAAARSAGFTVENGQVIAHGKLSLACADALFAQQFPNTILLEMDKVRFVQPIRSGDRVEVESRIQEIVPFAERGGSRITLCSRFWVKGKLVLACITHAFTTLPHNL